MQLFGDLSKYSCREVRVVGVDNNYGWQTMALSKADSMSSFGLKLLEGVFPCSAAQGGDF